ncbi:RNA 3'-terminal phosphate cyclase/enolpyruvate transferase, partial [Flagelloscypha sp. PMI_526]
MSDSLSFSGHAHFRTRLVLSIISGHFEVSLLRLLEKATNGTVIEISVTGATALLLKPGIISGGLLHHEFPVDLIRTVTLPHLQIFGISEGLELKIKKRGAPPAGGGEIQFLCPVVKHVKTINFIDPGRVKRIRGIAHAVRVSPQFSNRMIEASRSILNRYIPDIYLYSDVYKGDESGKSPGYALSLLAESTTSALYCAEAASLPGVAPEDIALQATRALLAEIAKGGCIDEKHQCLILLFMVLGSEDVGRCKMGIAHRTD